MTWDILRPHAVGVLDRGVELRERVALADVGRPPLDAAPRQEDRVRVHVLGFRPLSGDSVQLM